LILKSVLDAVMERRARQLMEQVGAWLPTEGPVLDLGSGTGHLSARLERELGLEVVTADVSDIHVVGPPPVSIADGVLPFEEGTFSGALLLFMLTYRHHRERFLYDRSLTARTSSRRMELQPFGYLRTFLKWVSVVLFPWARTSLTDRIRHETGNR
jgi:hypothetical protein